MPDDPGPLPYPFLSGGCNHQDPDLTAPQNLAIFFTERFTRVNRDRERFLIVPKVLSIAFGIPVRPLGRILCPPS